MAKVVWVLQAAALMLLAACGGGGGGNDVNTPPGSGLPNPVPLAAPVASAPLSYSSQAVTLSGTGSSDADGIASFAWTQTAGPTVTLAGANTATATFTSPPLSTRATLTFRLTVTDNRGATGIADVNVVVDPAEVELALVGPTPRVFFIDDEIVFLHLTTAKFQGQTVAVSSVTWNSSVQGPLTGTNTDLATQLQAGSHFVTATVDFGPLGTIVKTAAVRVLPRKSPVPLDQATAAPNATVVIPIVIINYFPTVDGLNVDAAVTGPSGTAEWTPGSLTALRDWTSTITTRAKFMLEEGSRFRGYKDAAARPYAGYRVVDIYNYYEEMPQGFPDPANAGKFFPDYNVILGKIPAQALVETSGVREFWLYSYHHGNMSLNESNMASPTGDVSNSYRTADLPIFANTYLVYQNNYTRSQAEAVHNHGHQIEAMLAHVNQLRDGNTDLFWRQFVGWNSSNVFVPGRCGATHWPLNASADYDYLNSTNVVQSDCEDWKPATLSTWGDIAYAWPAGTISQKAESQWYIYWMQNIPGAGNTIPYNTTTIENWWELVYNWDASLQGGKKLYQ
jgi:hypothetical protein